MSETSGLRHEWGRLRKRLEEAAGELFEGYHLALLKQLEEMDVTIREIEEKRDVVRAERGKSEEWMAKLQEIVEELGRHG